MKGEARFAVGIDRLFAFYTDGQWKKIKQSLKAVGVNADAVLVDPGRAFRKWPLREALWGDRAALPVCFRSAEASRNTARRDQRAGPHHKALSRCPRPFGRA
jgi:hypothetical protein